VNVLVVDSSSWISYFAGETNNALDLALKEARVLLPPIVAAELLSAKVTAAEKRALTDFVMELPLCSCTIGHWIRVGELRAVCAERGLKISTPDAHVAQCALDIEGYLMSEDKVFERIARAAGLRLTKA
jgi:tRNA(fMet)-specific endonuclease VapC